MMRITIKGLAIVLLTLSTGVALAQTPPAGDMQPPPPGAAMPDAPAPMPPDAPPGAPPPPMAGPGMTTPGMAAPDMAGPPPGGPYSPRPRGGRGHGRARVQVAACRAEARSMHMQGPGRRAHIIACMRAVNPRAAAGMVCMDKGRAQGLSGPSLKRFARDCRH